MEKRQPDYSTAYMGGVDTKDYPDLCDSFIEEMNWTDGTPMTDGELDEFMDANPDVVYELALESLY
tara:strand:+ start:168 stop:365 length:198 start_codon:yes stop_codon:yes gene_type:complete